MKKKFEELNSTFQNVIITEVWENKHKYIKWPSEATFLWPGRSRDRKYHKYPEDIKAKLKAKHISIDSRSNGSAIMAFLYAGGNRPMRSYGWKGWSIHHVYDGKFPFVDRKETTHVVREEKDFTQSAGLMAIHPIGDALCDELFYFAWLVRKKAFERFNYDPDNIFR